LKVLKVNHPKASEIARFNQNLKLIQEINVEGVVRTIEFIQHQGKFALAQEDFDGIPLRDVINKEKIFSTKRFLEIAVKLTSILANLHKSRIDHQNITPNSILINQETNTIKITDFGISNDLTRVNESVYNPLIIKGSLPYMSPEQTGRMNRSIDYRTDFYSLGIIFYEMLTGKPPFSSDDPMAIIHSHIALRPAPPAQLNSNIPIAISNIVMKLLEKNVDERYQNGFGLMADLKRCIRYGDRNSPIEPFKLGAHDLSYKFMVPSVVLGRELEIDKLLSVFNRLYDTNTSRQKVQLMLVSGSPGIGKSSLIKELQKPIVEKRGYFIRGKYEQFNRDKPYSAIIQAYQGLIKQLLSESNEQIQTWKNNLLSTLGENARIITDIIPDLELIIGAQPTLPKLGAVESKNRFKYVIELFVSVFSNAAHPIVLCLDDLQWADIPSMRLLRNIITSPDVSFIYIIGSYRDIEVGSNHPLLDTINDIIRAGIKINRIDLGPIQAKDIDTLIQSFLKSTQEKSKALADLVHDKTHGNPFFIIQFLETLHSENLITLDEEHGWQWDIERIRQLQVTDNVVKLLADKIVKLSHSVRDVLKTSAAIGSMFDLETLSYVMDESVDSILEHLTTAISEGFVNYSPARQSYLFNHDRIQEAAYSLVSDTQKAELHYRIGYKARELALEDNTLTKKIFYIVDQLNLGYQLIINQRDRTDLAKLNLEAGIKAKSSSAFAPAIRYFELGIMYLGEHIWDRHYDIALALYTEICEAAYLNGDYQKMDNFIEAALPNTNTILDQVSIISSRIYARKSEANFEGSIDAGLSILKSLGFNIPKNPSLLKVGIELIKLMILLRGRRAKDLLHLPTLTDEKAKASVNIICCLSISAFFVNPNLFALAILVGMRIGLRHGLASEHCFLLTGYGTILSAGLYDYDAGVEYGHAGLELIEKLGARDQLSKTLFSINTVHKHWKEPLRNTIIPLQEGYIAGLESGDLDFAAFNLFISNLHEFLSGKELSILLEDIKKNVSIIEGLNQNYILVHQRIMWQCIQNFLGLSEDPLTLTGKAIAGEESLNQWEKEKNNSALAGFYFSRLSVRFIFNSYELVLQDSIMLKKYMDAMKGTALGRFAATFETVSKLMLYPEVSFFKKCIFRIQIKLSRMLMKKWEKNSPSNNTHICHVINALHAWRVKGDVERAKQEFKKATQLCSKPDDIMLEAIFFEYRAIFYESIGYRQSAMDHMVSAYNAYVSWGAVGKVDFLKEQYPQLLAKQ